MTASSDWKATAAYLYVLHLSVPGVAWEYLRRNPEYRRDWDGSSAPQPPLAGRWGLEFLWDHALDAREARPVWLPGPSSLLRLCKSDEPPQEQGFSLWKLPGRKSLQLSGVGFLFSSDLAPDTSLNLAINKSVHTGCSFALGVSPHADPVVAGAALSRLMPLLKRHCASRPNAALRRPRRKALRHLRILQALDGEAAGATHREIATAIFGAQDVWERWTSDNSEVRAQVRYLLKCGHAFVHGGYRELLTDLSLGDP